MFGGNFAPAGWAFCDGSLVPISENDTLFNLIGTTYGGDGQVTFALPDLRGRLPIHIGSGAGSSYVMGQQTGVESVSLSVQQLPAHSHNIQAGAGGTRETSPTNAYFASGGPDLYASNRVAVISGVSAGNAASSGGNQPHDNMMPYLCVSFIISLFGIYPSPI
jgi:microcystin-dependent protein